MSNLFEQKVGVTNGTQFSKQEVTLDPTAILYTDTNSNIISDSGALYFNGTNLGVGTDNPQELLHVNGNIFVTNNITDGTFTVTASGLSEHVGRTDNPHSVTASQVGNTVAQWNANELQGQPVSTGIPNLDQVLKYNGSSWAPSNDTGLSSSNINVPVWPALDNPNIVLVDSPAHTKMYSFPSTSTESVIANYQLPNNFDRSVNQKVRLTAAELTTGGTSGSGEVLVQAHYFAENDNLLNATNVQAFNVYFPANNVQYDSHVVEFEIDNSLIPESGYTGLGQMSLRFLRVADIDFTGDYGIGTTINVNYSTS